MVLALQIAIRFLKSSKGQTILIALGIAVGVSVQVFIGSLIQGLQKDLVDTTIGNRSHITISNKNEDPLINYEMLMNDIDKIDSTINSISPVVEGPGNLIVNKSSDPIFIRGFDLTKAEGIYEIEKRLVEGNLPQEEHEVILGTDLVKKLDLEMGDEINLQIPLQGSSIVKLVGIYDFKASAINSSWVITTIPTAQMILGFDEGVNAIEIQVNDVFAADAIADQISQELTNNVKVENWKALNEDLLSGLQGQSISSIMIQVFVMVSVVLGIASVLAITVLQKSKQLGILKAMGIKNSQASLIFVFEGLILGLLGAILGVLFGLGLSYLFTQFAVVQNGQPVVNLYIDPIFITVSAVIAISAGVIASLIPARRSSKLTVIEVIRNG